MGMVLALVACTPFLGALNWLVIPITAAGFAFSLFAHTVSGQSRRSLTLASVTLSGMAVVISSLRLAAG